MMRQVLHLLADGRVLTISDLGRALGVRPLVVRDMLARLTALQYVQDTCVTRKGKNAKCAMCALRNGCEVESLPHLWVLSEKGRRAVSAGSQAPQSKRRLGDCAERAGRSEAVFPSEHDVACALMPR